MSDSNTPEKYELLRNFNITFEFLQLDLCQSDHDLISNSTLQQTLEFFNLPNLLKDLDQDLEMVKREINNKRDHQIYFNQKVNDMFRKVSTKYHPDRIKNRGGSEEDVVKATEMQKAVNLVWGILKMLHENFIDNSYLSDQDFKYSTCSTVEIAILGNEERLKHLNNQILIELSWLSRIKHEKMIPNMNNFLKYSKSSVQSFIHGDDNFEEKKRKALFHFHLYISGYKELFDALVTLEKNCQRDNDLAYIKTSVHLMLAETKKNLKMLNDLNNRYISYARSMHQNTRIVHRYIYPNADKDFVQPFMAHLDLIFKCASILKKERRASQIFGAKKDQKKSNEKMTFQIEEIKNKIKIKDIMHHYCLLHNLVSDYCTGINRVVTGNLKEKFNMSTNIDQKLTIIEILKQYSEYLESEFRPIKVYSECDIKAFKKNLEKVVEEFSSSMRETAEKGLDEIREGQNKMKKEFFQMQEEFKVSLNIAQDESVRRLGEMEQKIKEANEIERQMEERIKNEIQQRTKLEVRLREEIKQKARTEEQKLKRKSLSLDQEMESRIAMKLGEIMKINDELKKHLDEIDC